MTAARAALARRGEDAAADWLIARGFHIVARNARAGRYELDIVALHGAQLVFCEVRTRRTDAFGAPAETVGPAKQRSLRAGALRWLRDHPKHRRKRIRFDVAGVLVRGAHVAIDYYVDAF
ncbi:MAG: YraN family protein [Myxococcota bacterium]